jgi:hypothetical protein
MKLSIIVILTLFISLWNVSAMAELEESVSGTPFVSLASTDTTPVIIYAAGQKLAIPRNYLETAQVFMGRSVIGIETTFPDFSGYNSENINKLNPKNAFIFHDVVLIRRIDNNFDSDKFHNNLRYQASLKNKKGDLVKVPFLGADVRVGLIDPIEESTVIFCWLPTKNPVRCTVQFNVSPNLRFSYEYDQSLLPMWHQLDLGVRKLMATFLVGEK